MVKVGTSTLTHDSGALDLRSMERLVRTLADLQGAGNEVILVTSGAIAVGTAKLGLTERPKELRMKQAAAAVGQCRMMHIYDKLFSEYNRTVADVYKRQTLDDLHIVDILLKQLPGHIGQSLGNSGLLNVTESLQFFLNLLFTALCFHLGNQLLH